MAIARNVLGLVVPAAATVATGLFGVQYRPGLWYRRLDKPSWIVPHKAYPIIWPIMYGLMSLATWQVIRKEGVRDAKAPLGAFAGQLALNGAWTWLFFGKKKIGAALLDTIGLLSGVAATTVLYWRRSRLAGILMMPYLAWTAFASSLNFAVWRMNR